VQLWEHPRGRRWVSVASPLPCLWKRGRPLQVHPAVVPPPQLQVQVQVQVQVLTCQVPLSPIWALLQVGGLLSSFQVLLKSRTVRLGFLKVAFYFA
jgi:hypothetical protein